MSISFPTARQVRNHETFAIRWECRVAFSVDATDTVERMELALSFEPTGAQHEQEMAFSNRDASYDGVFYFAVKTTGIFCRPSCPSRPNRENVEFLRTVKECIEAGYRPCKRCRPLETNGILPSWVSGLIDHIESDPSARIKASDLKTLEITPERARRWFQKHYGMSFSAWCRGHRLACAFTQIREGASLDESTFSTGFESHSGFRDAFSRIFGHPPGRTSDASRRLVTTVWDSPIGPLLAACNDDGICMLNYVDRRELEVNLENLRRHFDCAVVPGQHPFLAQLRSELADYFTGKLSSFTVPIAPRGTAFQEKVWAELQRIDYGTTLSYDELASRIGQPTAKRAVARANGMNQICILIPCHRVIAKDGRLSGYGGGVWRKRLLLDLEHRSRAPDGL